MPLQSSYALAATPQGILCNGLPLTKQALLVMLPESICYLMRAHEVLSKMTPEDWDERPYSGGGLPMPKLFQLKMLLALASPQFLDKYNPYHLPAGRPDGGQFTSEDGAGVQVASAAEAVPTALTVGGIIAATIAAHSVKPVPVHIELNETEGTSAPDNASDSQKPGHVTPPKTIDDVASGATPDPDNPKLTGGAKQLVKPGNFGTADDDFDSLQLPDVQNKPDGVRVGTLSDGNAVTVRPSNEPTIEVRNSVTGKTVYKIRYRK